jgi:type II secretion system protein J
MSSRVDCGILNVECGIKKEEPKIGYLQSTIRNKIGFTLLEVLLALSILALVVTAVYASFSTTSKNIEQAEAMRDSNDFARTLLTKISDDIVNSYVLTNVNTAMSGLTFFYGKKEQTRTTDNKNRHDTLSLTTLTNWRKPDSKEMDLWEVGYFFKEKPDGSGFIMMRREKRELSKDVPAGEGGVEYQITDRVEGLQFRYNKSGDTWLDDWTSKTVLPKIVEIALTLDSGITYTARVKVELAPQ